MTNLAKTTLVIVICAFLTSICESANILFFFGVSTYSHRIAVWPLVEELAERGHNVTFFQPHVNRNPHPKVTELNPKVKFEKFPDFLQLRLKNENRGIGSVVFRVPYMGVQICESFLSDPKIIEWAKTAQFDLVIIDSLYNDCGLGLAYKFGAKHAIYGTSTVLGWWPDAYGFFPESNWLPEMHFSHPMPMGFYGRLATTLVNLSFYWQKIYTMFPPIEKVLREKLEMPDMPPLSEIESNTSLILMNTHFSEEVARSLPPLVISVGGMHCTDKNEVKPLPKAYSKFINDGGDKGFIYVSFGSAANMSSAPKELIDIFLNAMKNSKTQFLWKFERKSNIPVNVMTDDWLPQSDILGHPKIRGFITHGGLLGIQEAIHFAVPMIVMPIFAEQDYNAERIQRHSRGITLEINGLTQEQLEGAINTLLTDDSYRNKMKELSIRFKDRPQTPLQTAVWWTEYILRYDDNSILRPLATSQNWYQRRLLDVWAVILAVLLTLLGFILWILKKMIKTCMPKNPQSAKTEKSKSKQS